MVAYSFKDRFCEPIVDETKGGTIRNDRKRHARPGEELQLYNAMRTTRCRLVARKQCLGVGSITLDLRAGRESVGVCPVGEPVMAWTRPKLLDTFAIFDGFRSWDDLREFWRETHEAPQHYSGVHIRWLPWPRELVA